MDINQEERDKISKILSFGGVLESILTKNFLNHSFHLIVSYNDLLGISAVYDAYFDLARAEKECPTKRKSKVLPGSTNLYAVISGQFRELKDRTMTYGFSSERLNEEDINRVYDHLKLNL